jgi:hypothetical protein
MDGGEDTYALNRFQNGSWSGVGIRECDAKIARVKDNPGTASDGEGRVLPLMCITTKPSRNLLHSYHSQIESPWTSRDFGIYLQLS